MNNQDYLDDDYLLNESILIQDAKDGCIQSARALCDFFAERLEAGKPISPNLRSYIIEAMRAIGAGKDSNAAMHTKGKKGGSKLRNRDRDIEIALEVYWMGQQKVSLCCSKMNDGVFSMVGKKYSREEDDIKRICYNYLPGIKEHERINQEEHIKRTIFETANADLAERL